MNTHWLDKVVKILISEEKDIKKLMQIAGGNPETFFIGVDFDGVDLTDQDLTGINLSKSRIDKAITNEKTIIHNNADYSSEGLSTFWTEKGRRRLVWAVKQRRQEERIASIIRILLEEDDETAKYALLHVDKGKFATRILKGLLNNKNFMEQRLTRYSEDLVAGVVREALDQSFPLNRGMLLLYLSIYLGDREQISTLIKARLKRNYTMEPFFDDIEKILKMWKIKRAPMSLEEISSLNSVSASVKHPGGWI